jgi:hypothetical protein
VLTEFRASFFMCGVSCEGFADGCLTVMASQPRAASTKESSSGGGSSKREHIVGDESPWKQISFSWKHISFYYDLI